MKQSKSNYLYLVEGETEKLLINAIKNEYLQAGKVEVINITQAIIKEGFLRTFKENTTIILVFDTDILGELGKNNVCKINENIKRLKKYSPEILLIPQHHNFEAEMLFATNLKNLKDFFNTKTDSPNEFKSKFLGLNNDTHVRKKLKEWGFDIQRLWSKPADDIYKDFPNDSYRIKRTN